MKKCLLPLFLISHLGWAQAPQLTTYWVKHVKALNAWPGSMDVDKIGNIYLSGLFQGTVDVDPNSANSTLSTGGIDGFICKYNSSGTLVWVKQYNNLSLTQYSPLIKCDNLGNLIIGASFYGTVDLDPGPSTQTVTSNNFPPGGNNNADFFISKLDSLGNYIWGKVMGGRSMDLLTGITTDNLGTIYITGTFADSVDLSMGNGTHIVQSTKNTADIFISKIDMSGNVLWSKIQGGDGYETSYGIAVDNEKNILTTGWFLRTGDYNPGIGTYNLVPNGTWDTYLLKLDSSGSFIWAKSIGGPGGNAGISLDTDDYGNTYFAGRMTSADYDPGPGIQNLYSNGNDDIVVGSLDKNGDLRWVGNFGGADWDHPAHIQYEKGHIFLTGFFRDSVDFDIGPGVNSQFSIGDEDAFMLMLDSDGHTEDLILVRGKDRNAGSFLSVRNNVVYWCGAFRDTTLFNQGSVVNYLCTGAGDYNNIFLAKYVIGFTGIYQPTLIPFVLYPNPCKDILHVEGTLNDAVLSDIYGRVLRRITFYEGEVNIEDINPGIYFLSNGRLQTKLIIED